MVKPLKYIREYIQIVRAALWRGKVNHKGTFFTVNATLPRIAQIPLLTSALRENAFKQAGRCTGFASVGSDTWPPGSTPDCACDDGCERRSSCTPFGHASPNPISYGDLPFYASMFTDAGYPVGANGALSDDLIGSLVISGSSTSITEHFKELLTSGVDELMVHLISVKRK